MSKLAKKKNSSLHFSPNILIRPLKTQGSRQNVLISIFLSYVALDFFFALSFQILIEGVGTSFECWCAPLTPHTLDRECNTPKASPVIKLRHQKIVFVKKNDFFSYTKVVVDEREKVIF